MSDMPQDAEDMKDGGADEAQENPVMIPKELCPDCKPGDMLQFKVKDVSDQGISLEYVPDGDEEMSEDDMNKMSSDDAMKMPLDKLESSLPKVKDEE